MKTTAFLDGINNGYALLLLGEDEEETLDVKLSTLAQYISETLKEGDVLEIVLSNGRELIGASRLVEETEKGRNAKPNAFPTGFPVFAGIFDRRNGAAYGQFALCGKRILALAMNERGE
jgi:hypothetical protein